MLPEIKVESVMPANGFIRGREIYTIEEMWESCPNGKYHPHRLTYNGAGVRVNKYTLKMRIDSMIYSEEEIDSWLFTHRAHLECRGTIECKECTYYEPNAVRHFWDYMVQRLDKEDNRVTSKN